MRATPRIPGHLIARALTALLAALYLTACATAGRDVVASYSSPIPYASWPCAQLTAERDRLAPQITALSDRLDQAAKNDQVITGVGVVLFWPALFFLGGTKDKEAELARLKGEHEQVEKTALSKGCPRQ